MIIEDLILNLFNILLQLVLNLMNFENIAFFDNITERKLQENFRIEEIIDILGEKVILFSGLILQTANWILENPRVYLQRKYKL
jgi:hypothetical protein